MKLLSILFFVLSWTLATQLKANDCSQLWHNGYPDISPRSTPVACDPFLPIATPRMFTQQFFTVSSLTHDPAVKMQMEMIAEAIYYAVAKFQTYGRVPSITVVREANPHPNSGGPAAMGFTYVQFFNLDSEACPIFIYPVSSVLNKEHLQQMVAHEVFHCVQKFNFKDQVTAAVNASDSGWWFEGLAQLFSNYVYPRNDFEYTSRFPAPDQSLPFFDQPNAYSSENFWQSYANTLTDMQIFNLMGTLPTGGSASVAEVANNLPRISEGLHNYAKQITLKKVRDASGAMSPYDMNFESHVLSDSAHQELTLSHYDFTVGAYAITLPKAGKWRLTFTPPNETKISLKKAEESDYTAIDRSVEITTECDQERVIQIVVTRASADQAMNGTRLVVDKTPNPDCDCVAHPDAPPQVDACLIGSWGLDHSSVQQYWDRISPNPRVHFESSQGSFVVSFGEDHVGRWDAGNWALAATGELSHGMTMRLVRTTNGVSTFRYSANGNMACSQGLSMNMSAVQVISVAGRTGSSTQVLPFDPSTGYYTYSCDPTTFVLRVYGYNGQDHLINYVFHRL